ncbi:MAG: glutamate synthase subunit beta [Alphaproteobacteria bacterium]|nr:glutamate synthase subunit beta [Alphaproteobacteria bacterium]
MGKPTGFMDFQRHATPKRDPITRLSDFYEIYGSPLEGDLKRQGARCMDCGTPFCQSETGCPIDNLIPEWNDLVYQGRWREAYERLIKTNNFPEFTGRICPAPCEEACVLGIIEPAVTIKSIECAIIDRAFDEGWVKPQPPGKRTGKKIAIVGSGPAGLAAADQLNKVGHQVTVFERDDRIGGLLMYGVPNMKLDKRIVDRRVNLLRDEGIIFRPGVNVGVDVTGEDLRQRFDAVLLACGALMAREREVPGRELRGVHLAMEYLHGVTKSLLDSQFADGQFIDAKDKDVIVIGGGDTGADCIGTALRQRCHSVLNITRREREPEQRDDFHPWPGPRGTYYLDYSHEEGKARDGRDPREYGILPLAFVDNGQGAVKAVRIERLEWSRDAAGRWQRKQTGIVEELPADLVFLSAGFTGHDSPGVVDQLGVKCQRGTVTASYGAFTTNIPGVFAAGDMRRGASLIVWAIAEGRGAAHAIDAYLMGRSALPKPQMSAALAIVGQGA